MQSRIPPAFQLAGHEAVLRLHPVVLPARALDLVTGAFEPLVPELLQCLPLVLELGKHGQCCFNPRRFDDCEKCRLHCAVYMSKGEGLAARRGVAFAEVLTDVGRTLAIADHQPPPTAGTKDEAL